MRKILRAAMFVCLALIGSSAAIAGDKKPADPNKKICRGVEQTGSIFTHQVCHTRAEWAAIGEQNDKNTRATLQAAGIQSPNQQGTGY
ncbi:hypothetical protein BH10PSE15_BH10PSE15_05620 [soil metagenome]